MVDFEPKQGDDYAWQQGWVYEERLFSAVVPRKPVSEFHMGNTGIFHAEPGQDEV